MALNGLNGLLCADLLLRNYTPRRYIVVYACISFAIVNIEVYSNLSHSGNVM